MQSAQARRCPVRIRIAGGEIWVRSVRAGEERAKLLGFVRERRGVGPPRADRGELDLGLQDEEGLEPADVALRRDPLELGDDLVDQRYEGGAPGPRSSKDGVHALIDACTRG